MRRFGAALALVLAGLAAPALAADDLRTELTALLRDDARLQSIGWRIARANAEFCPDPAPATGLLVLDARSFKDPAAVRAALGVQGDFTVDAVAADSPAARAGVVPGEELTAIAGLDFAALPDVPPSSFARHVALTARIAARLAEQPGLDVTLRAPGGATREVKVLAEPACRSTFELLTSGDTAAADGDRVTISRRFLSGAPGDDEAAFVVAHELAHNILRHRAWLAKVGRNPANIRETERAADRLALWLMSNAGYDRTTASVFMQRWARRRGPILFPEPTHDGWKTRLRTIAAELPLIEAT